MTNKERILVEIERLRKRDYDRLALDKVVKFINSLPEEPVSEDLEKAAEDYADKHPTCGLAKRSFVAGAKWQKENGNH